MSKVLVGYYSGTGSTREIAERIGATLAGGDVEVDVRPFDEVAHIDGYDAVIAGSSVRAGGWHMRANRWMTRNADSLRRMPLALFTVGMAMAGRPENAEETRSCTDKLLARTGLTPLDIGLFAGTFDPSKVNFIERKAMEMHGAPKGDYRDWTAIEEWASSVAAALAVAKAA